MTYEIKEHRVGEVVTDLWWFSACDYDLFLKNGGELKEGWAGTTVVELKDGPGRYQLTNFYPEIKRDEFPLKFAEIRKIS